MLLLIRRNWRRGFVWSTTVLNRDHRARLLFGAAIFKSSTVAANGTATSSGPAHTA